MPLQRERCGQGRTRDDVRTVKRRKRRAPLGLRLRRSPFIGSLWSKVRLDWIVTAQPSPCRGSAALTAHLSLSH